MESEHASDSGYSRAKKDKINTKALRPPVKKYAYSIPKLGLRVYSDHTADQVKKQYESLYPERGSLEVIPVKLEKDTRRKSRQ